MCTNCVPTQNLETARDDAFGQKVMDVMNFGAVSLMVSVGHRTGLYDTMAGMEPATSEEIARKAGLNERYVREWLGAMTTGGFVDYEREGKTYHLPAERAPFLTRAGGSDNIATLCQFIPLLGNVEDKIVDCFERGGGVPYAEFGRFQDVMADDSGQSVVPVLLEQILPLVPGLLEGLKRGIDVLDIGCGQGRALLLLAEHYPNSRFVGYEISEDAILKGNLEAQARGLENIRFVYQDAAIIPDVDRFDFIATFDAIHDQAQPATVLENIHTALKPGGYYLMQDIDGRSDVGDNLDHPIAPLLYTVSCMHCMTVSLARNGAGLGTMWGIELAAEMLKEAGFSSIQREKLPHDLQNCLWICEK
jgi:SAM-dependent methyltransferase